MGPSAGQEQGRFGGVSMSSRSVKKHQSKENPAQALTNDIINGLGCDLVLVNLRYEQERKLGTTEAFERDLLPWTREVWKRRNEKGLEMWYEALVRVQPNGAVRGFSVFLNNAGDLDAILNSFWTCGTTEISMNPPVLRVVSEHYKEIFAAKLRVGQYMSYGLHP